MRNLAILVVIASMALVPGLSPAACLTVPSGQILARDLAPTIPSFRALDPDTLIGFAPFPGTVRVLSSHDVVLIGHRFGLVFPSGEAAPSACVERMVRHLSEPEMMTALRAALDIEGATLEILEMSNQPVPPGRLEFQRTFLSKPPVNAPQTPVIWRGKLIYDDQRSLMVWAKVRIFVDHEIFLARETIPKGAVIRADQVATDHIRQFPSTELFPNAPFMIVGKIARRTLPAGQLIVAEALDDLKDVFRGERVHVQAIEGGASIRFDAIAQSSGQKGDVILVHNPGSGKNFRALIEGREHVLVRGEL
jgi:flagella basal body P-ring formation protein FlgA